MPRNHTTYDAGGAARRRRRCHSRRRHVEREEERLLELSRSIGLAACVPQVANVFGGTAGKHIGSAHLALPLVFSEGVRTDCGCVFLSREDRGVDRPKSEKK